jgi:cytochrome P450
MTTTLSDSTEAFPQFIQDIFADDTLSNSKKLYQAIRDAGDLVWCPQINMFIAARYEDVRSGLSAHDQLISGQGVSLNYQQLGDAAQQFATSLQSDGSTHRRYKKHVMKPLRPNQIESLTQLVADLAEKQVESLLNGPASEGINTLAFYLPVNVVCDLVGINGVDSQRMQGWSEAIFNFFGPENNPRSTSNLDAAMDFRSFMAPITRADVKPGSWADDLFAAAERGEISNEEAHGLFGDYVAPSLDTTAQSMAEMLFQLSENPEILDKLRANPELIPSAVLESVRLATPIRGFSRYATEDFKFTESTLPKGSYVWLLNAAANLDERHYASPEVFDIERNPVDHLGWGHGAHLCIGKHLAKLEMESMLKALVKHVKRIEVDGVERLVNNGVQGYKSLTVRLVG